MGIRQRIELYSAIEKLRNRPLIVYVTSPREKAHGMISSDAVSELIDQFSVIPNEKENLDLLIISYGGDPTASWRIVALIRERFKNLTVMVPFVAFSAATLIALGADEIFMHPYGNLGPVDPQISYQRPGTPNERINFSSEDLSAFLDFAKNQVGLSDQQHLLKAFELFTSAVGATGIGTAHRSSLLTMSMGEKLLAMHMRGDGDRERAKGIAEQLNKKYFHHGFPLTRNEAKEIGLKVAETHNEIEALIWKVWLDIETELDARKPFSALELVKQKKECSKIFDTVPLLNIPAGIQANMNLPIIEIPTVPYSVSHALIESKRKASAYRTSGTIFATRTPDVKVTCNVVQEQAGWETVDVPKNEGETI